MRNPSLPAVDSIPITDRCKHATPTLTYSVQSEQVRTHSKIDANQLDAGANLGGGRLLELYGAVVPVLHEYIY